MIVAWCLPIRSFVCVVTVQGVGGMFVVRLSSCLVRRVPHTHTVPCLLHCSIVNVLSLLFQIDGAGILDSKLLRASFSPACKLQGYYAELT